MTPKLEIHPADGDFVAATYTLDKTASVTGRGFSAFDAVANLRVYLQPFGYELPNIELYASGGGDSDPREFERTHVSKSGGARPVKPGPIEMSAAALREIGRPLCSIVKSEVASHEKASRCDSDPLASTSPISECESAVDRVFKQHERN